MDRITEKMLKAQVQTLNALTGNPAEPWTRQDDGTLRANIGNYHLSGAYGGVALHRMMNESGGVTDVFNQGHMPKRDLSNRLRAYMDGIQAERSGAA